MTLLHSPSQPSSRGRPKVRELWRTCMWRKLRMRRMRRVRTSTLSALTPIQTPPPRRLQKFFFADDILQHLHRRVKRPSHRQKWKADTNKVEEKKTKKTFIQGDIHMRVLECLLPYIGYVEYLLQYPMRISPRLQNTFNDGLPSCHMPVSKFLKLWNFKIEFSTLFWQK